MKRAWLVVILLTFAFAVAACGPSVSGGGGDDDNTGDGGNPDCPDCICTPGHTYCGGPADQDVYHCNDDGKDGTFVEACDANETCVNGFCLTACEAASGSTATR